MAAFSVFAGRGPILARQGLAGASTPEYFTVEARGRDSGGEAAEERERVHVDGDGAVGVGSLERDPDEPVLPDLDALLRERRPEDVAQEGLPAGDIEGAGACGGVQRESVEGGAEGLVERERARGERGEAAEPLGAGGRCASGDGAVERARRALHQLHAPHEAPGAFRLLVVPGRGFRG